MAMRVAAFTELTGPGGVSIRERPRPEPGAGEAVVDVDACSINRHDLWILEGDSATVDVGALPFVSGLDVAGEVRAVGEGVDGVAPGDRVVACPNRTCGRCRHCREGPENRCDDFSLFHGGLAEAARVPADRLLPLPDAADPVAAAALPTAYVTAEQMLRRAGVEPGDRLLVPGATGGVGVASVQLAALRGLDVAGSSRSAEKLDRLADLGLDRGIRAADADALAAELADAEFDTVVNHLGGDYTAAGIGALRTGGRMLVCGRTAGRESAVSIPALYRGQVAILGSTMGTQRDLERLVGLVGEGRLDPAVAGTYPLAETGAAFAAMKRGDAVGKLVVTP